MPDSAGRIDDGYPDDLYGHRSVVQGILRVLFLDPLLAARDYAARSCRINGLATEAYRIAGRRTCPKCGRLPPAWALTIGTCSERTAASASVGWWILITEASTVRTRCWPH